MQQMNKVPEVTLAFWIIKICATTAGETGGDALSMTLKLGYAVSTLIFLGFFAAALTAEVVAYRYHPFLYWAVVVTTTTVGASFSPDSASSIVTNSSHESSIPGGTGCSASSAQPDGADIT